jgi:hypothetical protein
MHAPEARSSLSGVVELLRLLVRWILVVLACYAGFYAALIPGVFVHQALINWCPWGDTELVAALHRGESVQCPMPAWVDVSLRALFSSLAAIAVVLLGTVAAPIRRAWLPWLVYSGGAFVAVGMMVRVSMAVPVQHTNVFVPGACSLVTGALSARMLARRAR